MLRAVYNDFLNWKNSPYRKPLIVNGARQTGKTWLLKEFGRNEYKNMAYINCDNNPAMKNAFTDFDTVRLIRFFSALSGETIKTGSTLIVLDEVQQIPLALTSLKYFCENSPEYHIAVAGSLLGIGLHGGTGFPVGKVDEIDVYPMTFMEFLLASDNSNLAELICEHKWDYITPLSSKLEDLLRQYYFVGGMPEAVAFYFKTHDLNGTRTIQKRIIKNYKEDFSKHVPANQLTKVEMVWNSIPSQLAKDNKKFVYSMLKKGGRAKEFEDAIQWLNDAGLIYKVERVKALSMPLKFYEDFGVFKLFLSDLGLLGALSEVKAKNILIDNNIFSEYKGAFTEQFVAQQLISNKEHPYYYSKDNSTLELDFVIQKDKVYPIEVKAGDNVRSKSLKTVVDANEEMQGWRFSMNGYIDQGWLVNIPLYLVEEFVKSKDEDD
ncbi:ATP-binding protein [Succinivibrio sp.]|uniref:ATP-binding protein n=1 Tax=Succinivibrio sp. TaxID=2053619 RepID=UPI0025FEB0C4|nr:ATP-binding protein [Succinivibrio sp.]MBQ9219602.1 ATP-binding protein [Succinivibrio sp.]